MRKTTFLKTCCWGSISRNTCFLLFLFLLLFAVLPAQAQTTRVTGAIKDSKGTPLPGVSVVIKHATGGTTTDSDGRFSIEVPNQKSVLVFSLVGHTDKEEVVVGQETPLTLF